MTEIVLPKRPLTAYFLFQKAKTVANQIPPELTIGNGRGQWLSEQWEKLKHEDPPTTYQQILDLAAKKKAVWEDECERLRADAKASGATIVVPGKEAKKKKAQAKADNNNKRKRSEDEDNGERDGGRGDDDTVGSKSESEGEDEGEEVDEDHNKKTKTKKPRTDDSRGTSDKNVVKKQKADVPRTVGDFLMLVANQPNAYRVHENSTPEFIMLCKN